MAQASVATDVHQALDVVAAHATEVTLDDEVLLDDVAQPPDLLLGEVAHVALEGLKAVLGVGVVDGLVSADLLQHLKETVAGDPRVLQGLGGRGLRIEEGQEQVLGGDVLVLEGLGLDLEALLLGLDGGEKRRAALGTELRSLFLQIDAMPMRRQELRERAAGAER